MMIRGNPAPTILLGLGILASALDAQAIETRSMLLDHELAGYSPPAEDRAPRGRTSGGPSHGP